MHARLEDMLLFLCDLSGKNPTVARNEVGDTGRMPAREDRARRGMFAIGNERGIPSDARENGREVLNKGVSVFSFRPVFKTSLGVPKAAFLLTAPELDSAPVRYFLPNFLC